MGRRDSWHRYAAPSGGAAMTHPAQALPGQRITVLLVDDQQLLRSGFSMILSTEPDIEVIGTAGDGAAAIEAVGRLRPDVVLMDVQIPVLDGIEATRHILAQAQASGQAPAKIVMLTTFDRDDYLFDALNAGASGFLLKNAEADDVVEGVRTVHNGHALLAPEVTQRVIAAAHRPPPGAEPGSAPDGPVAPGEPSSRHEASASATSGQPVSRTAAPGSATPPSGSRLVDDLTVREREVLTTMAAGLSNAEIAAKLFLSEARVKTHVSKVLAKLGVRDRVQAVIAAYRSGLVQPLG